jgi:pimeloyl-ACP methyl ester carboxylesterase
VITVPTVTLEGAANGAPNPDRATTQARFSGPYSHPTVEGGVGHNLPQEAPEAFVDAIHEVGGGVAVR